MAQSPFAKRRTYLYTRIFEYEKRKEEIGKKFQAKTQYYKFTPSKFQSEAYAKRIKTINRTLAKWRKQLERMDKESNKLYALMNAIAIYQGINLNNRYSAGREAYNRDWVARGIYYLYGQQESKLSDKDLRDFIGEKNHAAPSKIRTAFMSVLMSKSDEHKEIREKWKGFHTYVRNVLTARENSFIDNRRAPGT